MRFRAFREQPLRVLIAEAGWRAIRSARKSVFRFAGSGKVSPARFHPLGYYRVKKSLVSPRGCEAILAYADAILRGEYPLMGYGNPLLGASPDWQCDWISGKGWPLEDSRAISIIRHDGSDVKAPWELSRLQFAPIVAKAWVLSGEPRYRESLRNLLADWIARNPVGMGVNWTVAMEAALRGISLCLTMDLLWPFSIEEQPWLNQLTNSLWQHLRFIEAHNEFSFLLRSNHYLSNIVGLTTLSSYLGMNRRREKYARAVQREILLQTYADGGDCEASTGYHFLVAQLGLHSFLVQQRSRGVIPQEFRARLELMFAWIASLVDDTGKLPHLGDCDNGRVELLFDDLAQVSLPECKRHSLRTEGLRGLASHALQLGMGGHQEDAIWFGSDAGECGGQREAKPVTLLPDSGIAVLRAGDTSIVFCAMPNGLRGEGSHTHCDKLSVVLRIGQDEVFCDSGSRCYTRSVGLRNLDRSSRAHNTLMIDEAEQNVIDPDPGMLFRCGNEAVVSRIVQSGTGEMALQASHGGYSRYGVEHQRTVRLEERSLRLTDEVRGTGKHLLELRFILGPEWTVSSEMMTGETVNCVIEGRRRITLKCEAESPLILRVTPAEISREYGARVPASCIEIHTTAFLPVKLQTEVQWD
jgi:hypothetical protein